MVFSGHCYYRRYNKFCYPAWQEYFGNSFLQSTRLLASKWIDQHMSIHMNKYCTVAEDLWCPYIYIYKNCSYRIGKLPTGVCVVLLIFNFWHAIHVCIQVWTYFFIFGQTYCSDISLVGASIPGCEILCSRLL